MEQDKTVVTRVTQIFITFLILVSFTLVASAEMNDSDKYTFDNYGGEVYTPEPMEFGANLNDTDSFTLDNETERKHVLLQFYDNATYEQLLSLEDYGVQILNVAADDTYVVSMPADYTAADLPGDVGLRWMGEIPVKNKYEGLNVPDWARTEDGQVELEIHFYEDITSEEAETLARKYSSTEPQLYNFTYVIYGIVTEESNITTIASEDIVKLVCFSEPPHSPEDDDMSDNQQSPGFSALISISIFGLVFCLFRKGSEN